MKNQSLKKLIYKIGLKFILFNENQKIKVQIIEEKEEYQKRINELKEILNF